MSTAIVSSSPFADFRDILYKSNSFSSKSHMKNILDRKTVGAPLGYTLSQAAASTRRNSASTASMYSAANFPANNFSSSKVTSASIISVSESCSSSLNSINTSANNSTTNLLSINSSAPSCLSPHRKLDRSFSEPVNAAVNLLAGLGGLGNGSVAPNAQSPPLSAQLSPQQLPPQVQPGQGNSSRYKTELCRPYEESGTCKYGDKCQFAHGGHELRTLARHPKYKTELCRTFHTTGFCPYGPRCHFIHNADESRKNSTSSACSDSSDASSTSSSSSGTHSPPPTMAPRPKAFSVGSFGSSSTEHSPPSSLSESPTNSIGSFFDEQDPFVSASFHSVSQPATPTANNAFTYSTQEFTSALVASGNNGNNIFNNNNNNMLLNNKLVMQQQQMYNRAMNRMNAAAMLAESKRAGSGAKAAAAGLNTGAMCNSGAVVVATSAAVNGGAVSPNSDEHQRNEEAQPEAELVDNLSGEFDRRLRLPIFSQLSHCDDN